MINFKYASKKGVEEKTRNREDRKQNWISAGNAQIGEVLRAEREFFPRKRDPCPAGCVFLIEYPGPVVW